MLLSGSFILIVITIAFALSIVFTSPDANARRARADLADAGQERPSPARVVEGSRASTRVGREMPFLVYLPPGYDSEPDARFPVLYMLHGLGGSYRDWQQTGLFEAATRLIESGQVLPMIIVTPEGGSGYWMDHYDGGPRYGSYITKGLIPYIDATYRTWPNGLYRAIGGASMGAHGALQLAFNNGGMFSIVGAHSVALRTKQQAFPFFGDQEYFEQYDPVSIIAEHRQAALGLTIWLDIGRGDVWYNAAAGFHSLLERAGVDHTWQVWEGVHDGAYILSHMEDYLRFYGGAFAANLQKISD